MLLSAKPGLLTHSSHCAHRMLNGSIEKWWFKARPLGSWGPGFKDCLYCLCNYGRVTDGFQASLASTVKWILHSSPCIIVRIRKNNLTKSFTICQAWGMFSTNGSYRANLTLFPKSTETKTFFCISFFSINLILTVAYVLGSHLRHFSLESCHFTMEPKSKWLTSETSDIMFKAS